MKTSGSSLAFTCEQQTSSGNCSSSNINLKPSQYSSKRQSGYNIELFVDQEAATKYLCSICHHVVADCHETPTCGHIFCGGCITRALSLGDDKFRCPFCNTNNHSSPRQSMYLNRAVGNLLVRCPFRPGGCDWVGSLSDLIVRNRPLPDGNPNPSNCNSNTNTHPSSPVNDNSDPKSISSSTTASAVSTKIGHLAHCQFAPVTCEQCGSRIFRKDMETHLKKCSNVCPHCKTVLMAGSDRAAHFATCPATIPCRLCKQLIKRENLNHHIEFTCSERQVKCPYYHVGCPEMIKLQNLSLHLKYNATTHNTLRVDDLVSKMEKFRSQLDSSYKLIDDYKAQCDTLQKNHDDLKRENIDLKRTQQLQAQSRSTTAPEILLLIGSNKWEESGVFMRRYRFHQERVCYTSLKNKCAIRWNPDLKAWLIDRRGLAFDNEASLIAYQDVPHPGLVTSNWLVYNDDFETWVNAENYRIESFNLAEFILRADIILAACDNGFSFHDVYTPPANTAANITNGNGSGNPVTTVSASSSAAKPTTTTQSGNNSADNNTTAVVDNATYNSGAGVVGVPKSTDEKTSPNDSNRVTINTQPNNAINVKSSSSMATTSLSSIAVPMVDPNLNLNKDRLQSSSTSALQSFAEKGSADNSKHNTATPLTNANWHYIRQPPGF